MIIAFITILLGLTAGTSTIEVAVSERVTRVEMVLNDAPVGAITGPPWSLEVDLGAELEPHRLVAIARDAAGDELGRAEQWINLPHQAAEAQLLIDPTGAGPPRFARLIWSAAGQGEPVEIAISFDGEPLVVDNPRHFALPEHDPQGLHFLRAELRFANVQAVAEAAFGGLFGEHVATDIQALALALDGDQRLPAPTLLSDWLRIAGESVSVRAVDAGPADLMIVVDLAAREALQALKQSNIVHRPAAAPRRERADPNLPGFTPQPGPRRRARSKTTERVAIPAGLHQRDRLRFVYPLADSGPGARRPYQIFPISEPFTLEHGGVFDLLTRVNLPAEGADAQRLADAVAIAGIQGYAGHRRRIVILVVGERPADRSRFNLPAVRRYLSRLHVPLVVWSVREPASDVYKPGRRTPPLDAATPVLDTSELGQVVEISSIKRLKAAMSDLRRQLDAQRIVWVDGRHLPQRFDLTAAASGVHWAGGSK